MKDMNAREIYTDMNNTLGEDCTGYSTLTKYLREKNFSKSMFDMDFESKIEEENCIDEAILEEYAFSPLCQIAKRILIPMSTVRYQLVNSLGDRIKNVRWVLHWLSLNQREARVEVSQNLLHVLRLAKQRVWKYAVFHPSIASHFLRGIRAKRNQPLFSLWIIVTAVLRNSFESLHSVPKHLLQGWSRDGPDDFINCCK
jgi:hypothetical protein